MTHKHSRLHMSIMSNKNVQRWGFDTDEANDEYEVQRQLPTSEMTNYRVGQKLYHN